jgi:membrane protease subunit (stomatin/prohibitin family)
MTSIIWKGGIDMAIVEVVKYNGGPGVFAWKYPSEELGTWTQLIVNESQEAVLYKGGQALDVFAAGRHTLSTANIPLLNKVISLPFGKRSPFTAEVWFINKVHSMDIKWGTPTPIQLQDPKYKVFVPLRSFGQFGIQIGDSKQFLTKLVGTLPIIDKDNILKFFRGLYLTKVKDSISSYLINKGVSALEINAYLVELSEHLKERITPTLDEYGIRLLNFFVNDINVPEDDPAVKKLKEALAKRAEMDIVGYNYVQERSFDTMEGAATNPGSAQSGLMGAGIGLGMGLGVGGTMGGQMGGIAQNLNIKETKKCQGCNVDIETALRFCPFCGIDTQQIVSEGVKAGTTVCSECSTEFSQKYKLCPGCSKAYTPCATCGSDMKADAVVCQVCGKALPKNCSKCGSPIKNEKTKFCPECGESLVIKCGGCGEQVEGNHKFCPECGKKVEV